jgi:hypothetical protein
MFGARTAFANVPRNRMSSIGAKIAPTFQVKVEPILE